jgi:hypothetical protein
MSGIATPRMDVHVGDVTGSHVVIGDYNTIQLPEGVKVTVLEVGGRPVPRLRAIPLAEFPPMRFALLGRGAEMSLVASSSPKSPFQVYGPEGIGKTVLLKAAAHGPADARDGVVFFSARRRSLDEVLARLYTACWESDVPYIPTPSEVRGYLVDREALVVLDDCELDRDDLEVLLDTAPRCRFAMGSERRTLMGIGRAEQLDGLEPEACMQLLERELGGVLDGGDRGAASAVIALLGGHPQRLVEAAALVQSKKATWSDLAGGAPGLVARIDAQALTPDERRILALLHVLEGAALGNVHVGALTNVARVDQRLGELERRGWIKSASPRYRLIRPLEGEPSDSAREALTADLLDHLTRFAREEPESAAVAEESEAIEAALTVAAEAQDWRAALALAFASERKLAQSGAWGSWRRVLTVGLRAAQALGVAAAEAHMLHQLGSLALCFGMRDEALAALREALRIRERDGDEAGAAVTRHNLRQLEAEGPGAHGDRESPSGPRWPRLAWVLSILGVIAAAIVAVVVLGQGGSHRALAGQLAIEVSLPGDGATYPAGKIVHASYRCTVGRTAALASCRGTVRNGSPIDSSTGIHNFEVVATDRNGRTATKRVTYRVAGGPFGVTAPTIVLNSPGDGATYGQGTAVTADYTCSDQPGGTGLASCRGPVLSGQRIDTSSSGQHIFTVSATDKAGHRSSKTASYMVTSGDTTAPTIALASPRDGARYVQGTTVTAEYGCADAPGGSGLASCSGPVLTAHSIDTSTIGQHTFTVSATDKAGNHSSKSASYTVTAGDTTAPTIALAAPQDGATYSQGAALTADYSCTDEPGGSGLSSCSGPVQSGQQVDTSTIGQHTFTVSATDKAGNHSIMSASYTVTTGNLTTLR